MLIILRVLIKKILKIWLRNFIWLYHVILFTEWKHFCIYFWLSFSCNFFPLFNFKCFYKFFIEIVKKLKYLNFCDFYLSFSTLCIQSWKPLCTQGLFFQPPVVRIKRQWTKGNGKAEWIHYLKLYRSMVTFWHITIKIEAFLICLDELVTNKLWWALTFFWSYSFIWNYNQSSFLLLSDFTMTTACH